MVSLLWKLLETIFKRKPRCNHSKILSGEEIEIDFKIFFPLLIRRLDLSEMCNVQHAFKIRFVLCHKNKTPLMYVTELIAASEMFDRKQP